MVRLKEEEVIARFRGENIVVPREEIDYMDGSPKQVVAERAASTSSFRSTACSPPPAYTSRPRTSLIATARRSTTGAAPERSRGPSARRRRRARPVPAGAEARPARLPARSSPDRATADEANHRLDST